MTSTESGLSVPDWPLSYGGWFPPMIGGIRFEHTHRMIAGLVGILTLVLAALLWRGEGRRAVRILGVVALAAVLAQAILGGLTVIYMLPTPVSVAHACLAQTFFCLVAVLALVTSRRWIEGGPVRCPQARPIRTVLVSAAAAAYFQLILGAVVRHTAGGGVGFHVIWAFVVALLGLFSASAVQGAVPSFGLLVVFSRFFAGAVLAQIFLGIGAYVTTLAIERTAPPGLLEVFFATAHQAFGALVLGSGALMAVTAFGRLKENPA